VTEIVFGGVRVSIWDGALEGTVVTLPADRGIHHLLADRVATDPDRLAVAADGDLTYRQLWTRSGELAAALAGHGVTAGDRVAVALDRSAALVVTLLATARLGAAYVPLDALAPPTRTAAILAETACAVVVQDSSRPAQPGIPAVDVASANGGTWPEPEPFDAETPLYLAYTSGSTGRPKGVVVPHRAVLRLVTAPAYCPLGPDDRVAQLATPAFDAITFEVWSTLTAGATVVVPPAAGEIPLGGWGELLRRYEISTMFLTTALFDLIARAEPAAFASLGTLLFGGEAVDPVVVRRVLDAGPPNRLVQVYGPTETTTFATFFECTPETVDGRERVPIGSPLQNTRLCVRDAELWIGGPGVALGYLDRPEDTAARFVAEAGGGRYRTGDRVRRLPDTTLEFLGRTDRQVKLRGFRVEPGEVEAAVLATGLVDAVAVAKTGDGFLAHLVGFVVGPTAVDLAAALRDRLPEYLIPARWVWLPGLPLTSTGKVDRARLLAADERIAPLSSGQEGLWFTEAAEPGTAAYATPLLLHWRGAVDQAALGTALTAVVARHEPLRTTYRLVAGTPAQAISPPAEVAVEVGTADGPEALAREPIDLAVDPPLRCTVWPRENLVLLRVHHIAVDGWSARVLLADLAAAYRAALRGQAPELPPLPIRYADHAIRDRDEANSPETAHRVAERAAQLRDHVAELSLDRRTAPPVTGPRPGAHYPLTLPSLLWTEVREVARRLRVTPFAVLLAAFVVVVRRWSGRTAFLLGTGVANRPWPELDELVGLFAGTAPLRCEVADGESFARLCETTADEALTALEEPSLPLAQLVAAISDRRTPLVQVVFSFQQYGPLQQTDVVPWRAVDSPDTGWAKYDLSLFLEAGPDGLAGHIEYDTTRYLPELAAALADGFATVLGAVCRDPGAPVAALPHSGRPVTRPVPVDLSARYLARLADPRTEPAP
jgi:amino acid adenylation domain-containing protein